MAKNAVPDGPLKCLKEQTVIAQHYPFNTNSLLSQPNVKLLTRTKALRLVIDDKKETSGIIIQNIDTETKEKISADFYVIAAGTINTLRIVHNSKVKNHLPVPSQLGKNIGTHPKCNIGSLLIKRKSSARQFYRTQEDATVWYQYGLDDEKIEKFNLPNHSIRFEPVVISKLNSLKVNIASYLIMNSVLNSDGKWFNRLRKFSDFIIGIISKLMVNHRYRVRIYLDHHRETGVNIKFTSKADDFLPDINIVVSDDVICEQELQKFCDQFSLAFLEESELKLKLERVSKENFNIVHSHFTGGLTMGSEKEGAMVNSDSKLLGIENTFIAGPAVFPTHSFCNPFMTIAAMSLRLGEHLNEQIR